MTATFKEPTLKRTYDNMRRCYHNAHKCLFNGDGSPRTNTMTSRLFWDGHGGIHPKNGWDETGRRTPGYAAWRAGQECARLAQVGKDTDEGYTVGTRFGVTAGHLGISQMGHYVPTPRLPPNLRTVMVGPFTVRIDHLKDYTVFVCDILGVTITRQRSYPSLGQLAHDLTHSVRAHELPRKEVERLWEAVLFASAQV